MECPKCGQPVEGGDTECRHCGIVFHKYRAYLERQAAVEEGSEGAVSEGESRAGEWRKALLRPGDDLLQFWWPQLVLWAVFVVYGMSWMVLDIDALGRTGGLLASVNMVFHEAGHVIFGVFGDFIGSLGGTLGQLLMPTIAGAALLHQRGDTFGASICLGWVGQNCLDIAPYMADARAGQLLLLGGNYGHSSPYGFHDWEYLLGETGLLAWDRTLAAFTLNGGRLIMVLAMAWGTVLLWRAWQARRYGEPGV
ncbi:zinc ribbon domain-containing protein [Halomonadaceae bacterium KBTZ08]